jgi:hypothetical protein
LNSLATPFDFISAGFLICALPHVFTFNWSISDSIHGLLDVAGYESYSTLIGIAEETLAFIVILVLALAGSPDLMSVAYVQFSMGIIFIFLNGGIIAYKGWFKPYQEGIVGTFALKVRLKLFALLYPWVLRTCAAS